MSCKLNVSSSRDVEPFAPHTSITSHVCSYRVSSNFVGGIFHELLFGRVFRVFISQMVAWLLTILGIYLINIRKDILSRRPTTSQNL